MLRVYSLVALLFTVGLTFTYYALFTTEWVHFSGARSRFPLPLSIRYGLFHKCYSWNDECVRFPNPKVGDCEGDAGAAFCDIWQLARVGIVLGALHGVVTLTALLSTLFGGASRLRKRWSVNATCLLAHAATLTLALATVGYLYDSSDRFAVGASLGSSYLLALLAVILDLFAVVILVTTVVTSPPEYQPIP
ncbi:hypothetical protein IWQ60_007412 [Tieghemiomyces parasiticus]|uniref:Uncharacterized protein n=1 Tax=Tieghemiomyces parasiticus TaxID=78921 RepID=A0A9W8A732_9FUNG|nr:hypothetical protein IWQ60_007412 [Tieghemiomyces parasiticus]